MGVDLLYTPSSSKFIDWYLSGGAEGNRENARDDLSWKFAQEGGVRFRFVAPRFPGIKFFGARFGVRANAFSDIKNARFIFEVGGGSW